MPRKLGEKLREEAAGTGYLTGELGVELLRRSLNEELDPKDLVEQYQQTLRKFDQIASLKLWGAATLTVKVVAAKRGLKLEQHGGLWVFINLLAKESGDKEFVGFFGEANALHRNFYENEMEKESVEALLEDIDKLIIKLKEIK